MNAAWRIMALTAAVGAAAPAAAAEPVDPDDLAALLADLEVSGGILTADDLAVLTQPRIRSARGEWRLAATGRAGAPPRIDLLAARDDANWSSRVRARRDGAGDLFAGWLHAAPAGLSVDLGGGALSHGAGLLAAPPGRRSSLSPDSPLRAPSPGWRPSTAIEPGATVFGGALTWTDTRAELAVGAARDQAGDPVTHLRGGVRLGMAYLAAVMLRRGAGRGHGLDLRWGTGDWRLSAEMARWSNQPDEEPGQAWHLAASWSRGDWRAEAQAAASDAPAGLGGAARPACLPGWRGRGWAVRVAARPAATVTAALVYGQGEHREPDAATGPLDHRSLLGMRVSGRVWELRLRRTDESRRRWDPLQPWSPAALDQRRLRTWLTAAATLPTRGGESRVSWRWLEEAGASRNLLGAVWSGPRPWGRWRVGIQLAWGDPLDLVAVSAPVPGLVRLRHWGHWQSGVLLGADGGRVWRWQCGGEARRRSRSSGGDLELEIHAGCGRSF